MERVIQQFTDIDKFERRFNRADRRNKNTSWFYIIRIHSTKTHIRYIKIGTTELTIANRFSKYKYADYVIDEIYFIAELDGKKTCYEVEDYFRKAWTEVKGFAFQRNDRFRYFNVPSDFMDLISSTLACVW